MKLLNRFNEFHDMAVKATGLDDFGDNDYLEPMRLVLNDYNRFTLLGEELVSNEVVGQLCGRLRAFQGFANQPESTEGSGEFLTGENPAIERPVFVVGVARSGTIATLRLLSKDPASQRLQFWLAASPQTRPPQADWQDNPQFQATQVGIEQAYQQVPEFRKIHPMSADEDRMVTEQTF